MAIQMRRGAWSAFDAGKMVPGELAVVISGDPAVTDGRAMYVCFASGVVKRVAAWEDASQLIAAALAEGIGLTITSANDAIEVGNDSTEGAEYEIEHKAPFSVGKDGLDPAASSIGGNTSLGTTRLDFGDGFWVPCATIDRYGHVTGMSYRKLLMPEGGYATEDKAGMVRPDGTSITVDSSGVIRALRPQVDSSLSETSEYAVQNKVVKAALDLKAPLASPALTGTPTAPSAQASTDSTQIATTGFTQDAIDARASNSNPAMDGTAAPGSSKDFARADHAHPTDASRAPIASPTFTGTPSAPTAAAGDDTTQLATTAFVQQEIAGKADSSDLPTSVSELTNDAGYLDAGGPFDATKLSGTVPAANLPSYVDDVVEGYLYSGGFYADSAHQTAITGEAGKIYVDLTDDSTYRWSGSAFVSISNPIDFATQAEAEAGTDNTKAMTALRTKQAIDANAYTHPTSGATAGSYGDASAQTPTFGGTFKVLRETVDADGHVTAISEHTVTIPGSLATVSEPGLMSAADKAKLDSVSPAVLVWDDNAGEYTPESVQRFLAATNDGEIYGVSKPTSVATAFTKLAANAGIAAPTPGWVGHPAVDPYVGRGPFAYRLCNGYVDADGYPHVTGIQSDGRFACDGTNGNVWNLHAVIFERHDLSASADEHYISNTKYAGMEPHPQCYLPDGSLRPFMLTPAYPLGKNPFASNAPASISGVPCRTRDVSHNAGITICSTATTGYSLKSTYDDWYVKTMFEMKYGTRHTQGVFAGCTSYNLNYAVTVAETGVTRVIIAKSNAANLLVGSSVSLGSSDHSNSVLSETRILSIESYDADNSAINLDTSATFNTTTSLKLSTGPWFCGVLDAVEGDGAISQAGLTSGKEPFKLQGIELMHGMTEILGNVIISNDGTSGWVPYVNHDSKYEDTSLTSAYKSTGLTLPTNNSDGWKYPSHAEYSEGLSFGTDNAGSSTTGLCDGHYTNKLATTGLREWRGLGSLGGGGLAGLWCVGADLGLTATSWSIGSRLSATGRALAE